MNSSIVFVGEVDDHMHCFIVKPLPGVKERQYLPKHIGILDIQLASSDVIIIWLEDKEWIQFNLNGIIAE